MVGDSTEAQLYTTFHSVLQKYVEVLSLLIRKSKTGFVMKVGHSDLNLSESDDSVRAPILGGMPL